MDVITGTVFSNTTGDARGRSRIPSTGAECPKKSSFIEEILNRENLLPGTDSSAPGRGNLLALRPELNPESRDGLPDSALEASA